MIDDLKIAAIADIIQNVAIEPSVLLLTSLPGSKNHNTLCQLPWGCVYTTLKGDGVTSLFATPNRRICGIVSDSDLKAIRLNRREMPLVFLQGSETEDIDLLEQEAITQNLVETMPQLLTTYGKVIIDCSCLSEIQDELLKQLYRKLNRKESVVFLGARSISENRYVRAMIDKGVALSFDETVWEFLDSLANSEYDSLLEDISEAAASEAQGHTFYIRKKSVSFASPFEKELLINVANFATLLNYEEVEKADAFAQSETIQRFQHFLQSSSSGRPQWYGFREEHKFHLTRYFEPDLYHQTIALLESAASRDRKNKPIILRGQACSGKTNALGALAYRIFHEHNYPVVYIHDPDIDLGITEEKNEEGITENKKSDGFVALEALLRQVENKSDNPVPTLILWDTSCRLQSEVSKASKLLVNLRSAGRLVQIICTSHEITSSNKKGDPFTFYDVIDVEAKLMGPSHLCADGTRCNEQEQVRKMLINYGGFRESDANYLMNVYGASKTFIASLYMFKELHRDLQRRLRRENEGRIEDMITELRELSEAEKERRSSERIQGIMGDKLRKELERVGWQLCPQESPREDAPAEDNPDAIRELMSCIALCTLYKERLPMTMVVKLLGTLDTISSEIFKVVTTSSLIRTDMSHDDEPMVSLRSELEAKLLLDAYDIADAQKLMLLEHMIDMASAQEDSKDVKLIQKMLQMMGPNNKYSGLSPWENEFEGFDRLADALRDFRETNNSPALLLQELTLRRELCNHSKYPYGEEARIQDLQETQALANQAIEAERGERMTTFLSNLYVEWANTTQRLHMNEGAATMAGVYREIGSRMERVISQFPKNGFAYSAYLWAGINYAKTLPDNDEKCELLQILGNIADTVTDEGGEATADTKAFGELDNLIDMINVSDERFDKSVQAGKSYGLYFKIREQIGSGDSRIDFGKALPDQASVTKRCRRVIDLWKNETYRPMIEKDAACMYAVINIKWMYYTRLPIIPDCEDVCVKLSAEQWRELYRDCDIYLNQLCRFRSPRIVFLQALAAAHLDSYRAECEVLFDELRKGTNVEIRSYYILSDNEGKPRRFKGQLKGKYDTYKNRGYIKVEAEGIEREIYFRAERIGRNGKSILERERFQDLSIAIGYRGFQVCKL